MVEKKTDITVKQIIQNIDEYNAMWETVEATHVPKPESVLNDTHKLLVKLRQQMIDNIAFENKILLEIEDNVTDGAFNRRVAYVIKYKLEELLGEKIEKVGL